jgi:serine/threonine protein kinase
LTRRLASDGRLALFRAAAIGDRGPGCYVLKMPRDIGPRDGLAHAYLRREAVVAAAVNHRSLPSIVAASLDGSRPYVALPYLEGITLRQVLAARASASHDSAAGTGASFALRVVRQVAAALAALHGAGWLHDQVRPEHVIVSPQGQATLIDLTQSRRLDSSECDAQALGSARPCYAAPETFVDLAPLTAATDI